MKCLCCGKRIVNSAFDVEKPNSPECIRCGRCKKACPVDAIQGGIRRKPQTTTADSEVQSADRSIAN